MHTVFYQKLGWLDELCLGLTVSGALLGKWTLDTGIGCVSGSASWMVFGRFTKENRQYYVILTTYRFYRYHALYSNHGEGSNIPISLNKVEAALRKLAKDSANVYFLPHASSQMDKRGIVQTQVINCLKRGTIMEGPTLDSNKQRGWKVTMELFCAGRGIGVAAKLVEKGKGHILVITAFFK